MNDQRSALIITYDWPPSAEVGAVRVEKIARSLDANGITPVILTVREVNYARVFNDVRAFPFSVVRTKVAPNPLKIYKYLKNAMSRRGASNNIVRPSQAQPERDPSQTVKAKFSLSYFRRLILSLFFTPDEFLGWFTFATINALSLVKNHRISRVITTGPPFTTHLVGLAVKRWRGEQIKWIADFRDPWVANQQRTELITTAVSDYFNRVLERQVILHADHVVCVTPSMTDWYRKRYPNVKDSVWQTITNGFERKEFDRINQDAERKTFTISYIGSIEYERSPEALLHAVAELCQERVLDKQHISIRFIGKCDSVNGRPTTELIRESGLDGSVELVGLVPRSEALREMKESHVLLLLANAQQLQVPGKAYEYIAAGSFILALTEEHGATADLIRRIGGGSIVQSDNRQAIKGVLRDRYEAFVRTCSDQNATDDPIRSTDIFNEYEWDHLGSRYAQILR